MEKHLNKDAISQVEQSDCILTQIDSNSWLSNLPIEPINVGQAAVVVLMCGVAASMIISSVSKLVIAGKHT